MTERYHYLDRIRTMCILGLFPFHVADYYAQTAFALATDKIVPELDYLYKFFTQWRLALLFFIAGLSARLAYQKYGSRFFLKERLKRIFVPLILGSLILVAPQIYIERLQTGSFSGSYLDFLPQAFQGIYPSGNMSWGHLWFLFYLLFYSVVFVGVSQIKFKFKSWWVIFPVLVEIFLRPHFVSIPNFITDFANILVFGFYFFMGTLFDDLPTSKIIQNRKSFFFLLILLLIIVPLLKKDNQDFVYNTFIGLRTLVAVMGIVPLLSGWNEKPGRLLNYFKKANYPLYILHHTVIIFLAYFMMGRLSPLLFFLTVTILSFLASLLLYEMLRRFSFGRLLLGMK